MHLVESTEGAVVHLRSAIVAFVLALWLRRQDDGSLALSVGVVALDFVLVLGDNCLWLVERCVMLEG